VATGHSDEYANLVGGELYEPHEENPMIGYRGASRYLSPDFADCSAMECEALSYVRDRMGPTNVQVMIPFVRTLTEAEGVIRLLGEHGLRRGENGLEVIMMCELPSNAVLADRFLDHFDGFSIGSDDMTQLTLGDHRRQAPRSESSSSKETPFATRRHHLGTGHDCPATVITRRRFSNRLYWHEGSDRERSRARAVSSPRRSVGSPGRHTVGRPP
jgi:phosphoenolpyruvate synthase/pyruvate phosphate dikinase